MSSSSTLNDKIDIKASSSSDAPHKITKSGNNDKNIHNIITEFETISVDEASNLLQMHRSMRLPECADIFPWLHANGTSNLSLPPIINERSKFVTMLRSCPIHSKDWIDNSGYLKNSIVPSSLFIPWHDQTINKYLDINNQANKHEICSILRNMFIDDLPSLTAKENSHLIDKFVKIALTFKILPFLKTDLLAMRKYCEKNVGFGCNNSLTSSSNCMNQSASWKQAGTFRRFDLQPARILEISSNIIIYCFKYDEVNNCFTHIDKCENCFEMGLFINFALHAMHKNYSQNKNDNIYELKRQPKISILNYNSLLDFTPEELPSSILRNLPMSKDIHSKDIIKSSKLGILSPFEIETFNNWDKDITYHERLEISRATSTTFISEKLWCGNLTDFQFYKQLMDNDISNIHEFYHSQDGILKRYPYYSPKNTIVTLPRLSTENLLESELKIFNIPNFNNIDNSIPIFLYIKCTENSTLPNIDKLWNILKYGLTIVKDCLSAENTNAAIKFNIMSTDSPLININDDSGAGANETQTKMYPAYQLSFPSSGSITLGSLNISSIQLILNTCYLIYQISQLKLPNNNNAIDFNTFLYCKDGYTETSLLLVAYLIFLWDVSLEETLLRLHLDKDRPFYLFSVDLQVLAHLQTILREFSPKREHNRIKYKTQLANYMISINEDSLNEVNMSPNRMMIEISQEMFSNIFLIKIPTKVSELIKLNGPLPSRILNHLYLGSLDHAQNPVLLKKLKINYIVSVGENLSWTDSTNRNNNSHSTIIKKRQRGISTPIRPGIYRYDETMDINSYRKRGSTIPNEQDSIDNEDDIKHEDRIIEIDGFKILHIDNLQDNGKDPLLTQLNNILEFINECYENDGKVLIHCMVGVSRSATVCIAECMKRLNCNVLKAYLFVRMRRLNIIIQPNLMFMYELLKWQELQGVAKDDPIEWNILCKSIAELNTKYI
ncbi:tyrosine/serine/threonine protein phosphatase PPS1 NDAI_0B04820 [Naumovozyma dairenensis CBS 421]|uniref:Uncharacterized protein n=1 Tax=Naumovozyma dairenensis (strain ATCC 10597 / BCRC 20456 / CBS 421 / NBRC 0211 / NRRL Y-12639) TaxID=1071378 RepID=G0W6V5_NAUDC|nr:hypothetical protein NDAI_0B04820 [Naumovozyma dairenensis CBS 421]CCD23516.1 hypothetical protein NDAI_0B04820 [Naumovozyma dairenensis CBS 421]